MFGRFWGSKKRIKRFKDTCEDELLAAFDEAKKHLKYSIELYDTEVAVYQQLINQGQAKVLQLEEILYHLPDVNGDNLIDRAEFEAYMSDYKKHHPNVKESDIPVFSDMDLDMDGQITFEGKGTFGLCSKDNMQ